MSRETAMLLTFGGLLLFLLGAGLLLVAQVGRDRRRAGASTTSATKPRPVAFSNLIQRCEGTGLRPSREPISVNGILIGECPLCQVATRTVLDYDRREIVMAEHRR